MACKEKPILTWFLFILFGFIEVSGFVVFNEDKRLGFFNKNERATELFGRGEEKPNSEQQAGRLIILQNQPSDPDGDDSDGLSSDVGSQRRFNQNQYQSADPGWMKMQPLWGGVNNLNPQYTTTVNRLLGMKPTVDCVGDLMKLTIHGHEASFGSNFLINRGSSPPLPLSQLPSECGHRFLRTWRDFVFVVPFDGCYVSQERDMFVLPLLWWGLPLKMSCSSLTSSQRAPTVSCHTNGMIVTLYNGASENLKVKVMNEWQPLLKVSASCGYSLVSHPEGVVIHVPYVPCTKLKDGMFTLSIAKEREFNLSCPSLSLNLPVEVLNPTSENDATNSAISSTLPPTTITTTTKTTPPTTSTTIQKFPSLLSRLQAWYPKPSFGLSPDSSQSAVVPYFPRDPLLPPAKAPETPLVQREFMFPPSNLAYALYPGKPPPSSVPVWPYHLETPPKAPEPHVPLKPGSAPPIPVPTSKTGPQLIYYPWYKPLPPKVPQTDTASTSGVIASNPTTLSGKSEQALKPQASVRPYQSVPKGPPMKLQFDFVPSTDPSPLPPKSQDVRTPAPISVPLSPISSSHAHFRCPVFCPGPPSISYHHHDHHHFGHPSSKTNLDVFSLTKITGQRMSSPDVSKGSPWFPFIQGMGNNYGPFASKSAAVPIASYNAAKQYLIANPAKGTAASDNSKLFAEPTLCPYVFRKLESAGSSHRPTTKPPNVAPMIHPLGPFQLLSSPLQNRLVAEPLAYSDQSPNPAVYQPEVQQYVSPWGHHMPQILVPPNNVPSETMVQHDTSAKPTVPPADVENLYRNYWYEATSNAKPFLSDSFNQMPLPQPSNNHNAFDSSPQPDQTHGMNPPMQLNFQPLMHIHDSVPQMSPQLYHPHSAESVAPVFEELKPLDTYWFPAAQSKQDS